MSYPSDPQSFGAPSPRPNGRRSRVIIGGAIALFVTLVFALGLFIGSTGLHRRPADDPALFLDDIADAEVVCVQIASLIVERDHKTLGCATQTNGILTVETWGGGRPPADEWLEERCALLADFEKSESGAFVEFPEGLIRVANGAIPVESNIERETPEAIADRLATAFGGTATTYSCPDGIER